MTSISLSKDNLTNKHNYVCEGHFLSGCITANRRLTKNAVPFLNYPDSELSHKIYKHQLMKESTLIVLIIYQLVF